MSVTIVLVGLVVFAFFAGHLINRYASRFVPVSGVEYLVIGALIGPQIPPHVLTVESLAQMSPLVSLLLGLTGFLVGLQAVLRTRSWRLTAVGVLVALGTLLVLSLAFAAAYGLLVSPAELPFVQWTLGRLAGFRVELFATRTQTAVAVVLAAVATVTFSTSLSGRGAERLARVPAYRLLRSCAFSGQWVAVTAVALVLAWTRSGSGPGGSAWGVGYWFAGAVALGVVLGVCFGLFIGEERSPSRLFLATVGTVTFGAGVGAELGVSPMFVNLVTGVTVALTSRDRDNLHQELSRLRHPISVLLLVLIGAMWVPPSQIVLWAFPLVYLAGRWAARWLIPGVAARLLTRVDPTRLGVGLLSQGTLAVAVAMDYALQKQGQAGTVLTTAIVGALVFDVFARGSLKRYLIDAEAEQNEVTALSAVVEEAEA